MANVTHGAYQSLDTYERLLGGDTPDLMAAMPADTDVGRELRFARMKLARVQEYDPEGVDTLGVQTGLLDQIRKLASTQNELRPGGDASGSFTVEVKVVGAPPVATTTPVPESGDAACS